jgi:hypothetical protein
VLPLRTTGKRLEYKAYKKSCFPSLKAPISETYSVNCTTKGIIDLSEKCHAVQGHVKANLKPNGRLLIISSLCTVRDFEEEKRC